MKLGLIGGTFDPIHYGHLLIAQEAGWQLGLDRVLFIPAGDPPHKQDRRVTPARCRLEMTRLATGDNPLFEVSTLELDRQGLSYTADTLAQLRDLYRQQAELFFIIGADAAAELLTWYRPQRVLELARLVVAGRPGYSLPFDQLQAGLPDTRLAERLVRLEVPLTEIASRDLRHRVAQGISIRYLVPDQVAAYIEQEKLYRLESAAPDVN